MKEKKLLNIDCDKLKERCKQKRCTEDSTGQ